MPSINEIISNAVNGVKGERPEVKAAVAAVAAVQAIPPPVSQDAGTLWKILVTGLVATIIIALGGIIYAVADGNAQTSPDVIVTIFSSALAGLIGLFVRTPTST